MTENYNRKKNRTRGLENCTTLLFKSFVLKMLMTFIFHKIVKIMFYSV